jgi:iron(III) transport system substrate-binding protein
VQVADPNSSGTAYIARDGHSADGRGEGVRLPEARLHRNINQYTKSGAAPAKATSLGENIDRHHLQHDMVMFIVTDGAPIKIVAPCEGTVTRSAR